MNKILVFDTYEDAYEQLIEPLYNRNLEITTEIYNRYHIKQNEFLKTCERYKKELAEYEKAIADPTKNNSWNYFPVHPSTRQLPADEQKELDKLCTGIGEGLELKVLLELEASGNKFYFCHQQDGLDVDFNSFNGYKTIPKLAKYLKEILELDFTQRVCYAHYGALFNPVFFTLNKEEPIFTEEQKQSLTDPELKKEIKESNKYLKENGICFFERLRLGIFVWLLVRNIVSAKETVRGLTEKERKEFEKIYF